MPEYLELRSRVTDVYDYKKVDVSSFVSAFTPDPTVLEKDMQRVCTIHGEKQDCDEVQNGDLVMLSCRSDNQRYCKDQIMVPVGKGLFSKELEQKITGMKTGVEKTINVDGAQVVVCIKKVTRTVLPELTDESVKSWGMEGVDSVAALKKYCINRQIDRFLNEDESADSASAYVWQTVGENSTFVLDQEEYDNAFAEAEKKRQEMEQNPPMDADDEPEEENAQTGPLDMTELVHNIYIHELKMAVIGNAMARDTGKLLTTGDYDTYIMRWMESDSSLSQETARQKFPLERFLKNRYADVLTDAMDIYVTECFKKAMNP